MRGCGGVGASRRGEPEEEGCGRARPCWLPRLRRTPGWRCVTAVEAKAAGLVPGTLQHTGQAHPTPCFVFLMFIRLL